MRVYYLPWTFVMLVFASSDGRAPGIEMEPTLPGTVPGKALMDRHGDPLPAGAIARLGTQRLRHPAWGLAFAADGKTFATAGHDGLVRLINATDAKEIRQFRATGLVLAVNGVAFAADGKTLFSCGIDGLIRQWSLAKGVQVRALPGTRDHPIYALAPHPNKRLLLAQESGGTVHEWDLENGKETRAVTQPRNTPVALCTNGKHFAVFKDNALTLRDLADQEIERFPTGSVHVPRLAFSADGGMLAAGCSDRAIVWEVRTGKEIRTVQGAANSHFLAALSANGRYLALKSGSSGPVQVLEVASGKVLHQFRLALDVANVLTFAPDDKVLACSGGATAHLWKLDTGRPLSEFDGHPGTIDDVRFSPDGKSLLTTSRYGVVFWWDTASSKPRVTWKGPAPASFRFLPAPDGQTVFYVTPKGLMRCDCNDGRPAERPLARQPGGIATCVALNADSKLLAVRSHDNATRFVAVDGGKELGRVPVEPFVFYRAAFSPNGKHLASGGPAPQVSIWSVPSGALVRHIFVPNRNNPRTTSGVSGLLYSPDGRSILTLNAEATLWEAATGRERWRANTGFNQLTCGALIPNGRLAALGSKDGTIYVVSTATGAQLGKFGGGSLVVNSLDFSFDGKRLASGGDDGLAMIWDTSELCQKSAPAELELKPQQLAVLWRDLDSDAVKAHAAVRTLAASPTHSVPFLHGKLRTADPPDPKRVERLIVQLDADDFEVREKAHKELEALHSAAIPFLRKALENKPSAEVKDRVTRLLEPYKDPDDLPERLRTSRALESLEHIGTLEALKVLKELAERDPNAPPAQEAKESLDRLTRRLTAP